MTGDLHHLAAATSEGDGGSFQVVWSPDRAAS
jgi:hypothetical protein